MQVTLFYKIHSIFDIDLWLDKPQVFLFLVQLKLKGTHFTLVLVLLIINNTSNSPSCHTLVSRLSLYVAFMRPF